MKKYLIIRFSSIGDIVLTTPVIRCLKKQATPCEVHFLTKEAFIPVVEFNPYIDKIISIRDSINEVIAQLKNENYDYVIDLHKNFRSFGVRSKLKVTSSSFSKLNFKKWLLVYFKIDKMPDVHIVDRYFEAVCKLGIKNDLKGLDYFIDTKDNIITSQLPNLHQNGYVTLVIGGKHKTKQLPLEKAKELCGMINHPVIILGGVDDTNEGNLITATDSRKIFNGCGKFTLNQSAYLIKKSKLVITNDTGLMHVAAAFHKNIISVWGNTVPQFGMYPYLPGESDKYSVYEVKGLSCRPCSKIGFQKCPKGHFKCMMEQDIAAIADEVNSFWGKS